MSPWAIGDSQSEHRQDSFQSGSTYLIRFGVDCIHKRIPWIAAHRFEADEMLPDFAEVGTTDFSEICLLVSVAGEARAKMFSGINKRARDTRVLR